MLKNMEEIEKQSTNRSNNANGNGQRAIITIPTVVHVVYRTTTENISDAQVQSQIDVLNADFKALNSDLSLTPSLFTGVIGNPEIEFCLRNTGSFRECYNWNQQKKHHSDKLGQTIMSKKLLKEVSILGMPSIMNIWVCNIGGGILGYAHF